MAASLVFYSCQRWQYVLVILGYCVVNWAVGVWLPHSRHPRLLLAAGVGLNLAVLSFWKYTPMLVELAGRVLWPSATPTEFARSPVDWVIPFGISFYAFTGIAYIVDVYRGHAEPERNLARFVLFITFFPQLVAGPILRAKDFLTDLRPGTLPERGAASWEAIFLAARGLFKKMVLADRIALAIDPFFAHVADDSTAGVWALPYIYLYGLQILFDFSGYTDIARGLGLLFGFRWPENFNAPYLATSIAEFWRRWHMTLSSFLRDYLYVPLGGNRHGRLRTHANLMITMLLGGIWHGPSMSFMLWGGLHGLCLCVHRLWRDSPLARLGGSARAAWLWKPLAWALTLHCVMLSWCFFRLTVFSDSLACICKLRVLDASQLFVGGCADLSLWTLLAAYGGAWPVVWFWRAARHRVERPGLTGWVRHSPALVPLRRGAAWGFAVALVVLARILSPSDAAPPFIYFQF